MKPVISIIMGIYNSKKDFLELSLKSILNQSFKEFEFIICDDGSKNECLNWAKEFCNGDDRVIFLKNDKNMGLSYTLNKCLKKANGKFIARMDDDDISHLDRLEKQLIYLNEHKEVGLVSCNINVFNEVGIYSERIFNEVITKNDFLFNSPIVHPAILAKKECFEVVNGYRDEKVTVRVEDYDMFMRMFYNKIEMRVLQEKLFDYREDDENLKRRKKFKYRINEMIIRFSNFYKLKLFPKGIIYALKPIVIGILPTFVLKEIKHVVNKKGKNKNG